MAVRKVSQTDKKNIYLGLHLLISIRFTVSFEKLCSDAHDNQMHTDPGTDLTSPGSRVYAEYSLYLFSRSRIHEHVEKTVERKH